MITFNNFLPSFSIKSISFNIHQFIINFIINFFKCCLIYRNFMIIFIKFIILINFNIIFGECHLINFNFLIIFVKFIITLYFSIYFFFKYCNRLYFYCIRVFIHLYILDYFINQDYLLNIINFIVINENYNKMNCFKAFIIIKIV